jgi:hypothetical protein
MRKVSSRIVNPRIVKAGSRLVNQPNAWPPVIIVWVDAESHTLDNDMREVEANPLPERRSIGFLARNTKTHVTIVGTDDRYSKGVEREMVGDALRIPKGVIKMVVPLKEDKRHATHAS